MWECRSNEPEDGVDTADASRDDRSWTAAAVPGTAAGALRDLGQWTWGDEDQALLDGSDWWYRCRFDAPEGLLEGPWQLDLDGLATVADVWLNDEHLLHSENMWVAHQLRVDRLEAHNMLLLRFAALAPLLARRRPRPRWRSLLLRSQNQRWYRTTLLGRVQGWAPSGAPVGPWRPVRLRRGGTEPFVAERSVHATCDGADGVVEIRLRLEGVEAGTEAELRVGDHRHAATVVDADGSTVLNATIRVPAAERWWPHTHGDQPLYRVGLTVDGIDLDLGTAGFRTVEVDRADGAFTLSLNGVPIFCRGALWVPPDAVTLDSSRTALRTSLQLLADAGMNMVRIGGYMSYESSDFWDLCDELGILVWQDCMLAGFDPPEEPEFVESVQLEVRQQLGLLTARPSLAVVCASSETQQQAAMYGLPSDGWHSPLLEETIPALAHDLVPDLPCVVSSPSGGDLPFEPGQGIAHYFGVGAYLRPLTDACVQSASASRRNVSPSATRRNSPPWSGASATRVWLVTIRPGRPRSHATAEPRGTSKTCATSTCARSSASIHSAFAYGSRALPRLWQGGGRPHHVHRGRRVALRTIAVRRRLDPQLQDISPGAGWGLLDSFTEPKAPWYTLRRVLAPVAALITDEGLAGLRLHVVNDQASSVEGTLRLTLFNPGGSPVEEVESAVQVDGRGEAQWNSATLLGGFRDLNNAYRFGPPAYDVVQVRFETADAVSETFQLPAGSGRPQEPDLGLEAGAAPAGDNWQLSVRVREVRPVGRH